MSIDANIITWLVIGSLLLGTLAVVLDRMNFPQKPFRPKRIETPDRGARRDRNGANIVDAAAPEPDTGEAAG
ncbi:MAG: hypothetical protein GY773_22300 [Actinomycetia bacterium]|nr:hypothetical protein [Actinomycetes bacterium]